MSRVTNAWSGPDLAAVDNGDPHVAGDRIAQQASRRTLADMSVTPDSQEPTRLTVLPPKEALERARPMPSDDEMTIEGLTDDEWKAFEKAIADR